MNALKSLACGCLFQTTGSINLFRYQAFHFLLVCTWGRQMLFRSLCDGWASYRSTVHMDTHTISICVCVCVFCLRRVVYVEKAGEMFALQYFLWHYRRRGSLNLNSYTHLMVVSHSGFLLLMPVILILRNPASIVFFIRIICEVFTVSFFQWFSRFYFAISRIGCSPRTTSHSCFQV